jgi:5-oxopent-3-ene-1,2,5-tricarboxylate decarboxylase / 2-hydroxyhepta-2,4-diene-1,7-dioate isomerase
MLVNVAAALPTLGVAPWRLSGQVVGVLMNDPLALAALGEAVHAAPYKAPPMAPVLYVKPRNTLQAADLPVVLPFGIDALEVGVALGLVFSRTACRVPEANALAHVGALVAAADLSVPHTSFYRPAVRFKALDGSCRLGQPVPLGGIDPDALELRVDVDGVPAQAATTARFQRQAARLVADVSAFMTLHPGDVLLTGVPWGAPLVHAGQRARIEISSVGTVDLVFVQDGA